MLQQCNTAARAGAAPTPCGGRALGHKCRRLRAARAVSSTSVSTPPPPPAAAVGDVSQAQAGPYRVTDATVRDLQSMYASLLYEFDYTFEDAWVEGTIPADLRGTYVRNGPGLQVAQRHTFDGDGMVLSFAFPGGEGQRPRFKNRFVRTKGFVDEQAASRPLYRTAFTRGAADGSLLFNPFDFKLKNCANTGVLAWAGRLYALYESGLPHELDAATLATVGESTVGGQLATPVLAAHYRVVPRRRRQGQQQQQQRDSSEPGAEGEEGAQDWVAFSANTGLGGTELIFYEFGPTGRLAHAPVRAPLRDTPMALIHDIAVTDDYYVAHVGPLEFSPGKFLTEYFTSRCAIAECLQYRDGAPAKVLFVPRPGGAAAGAEPFEITAPPAFVFHHANAFQTATSDGRTLVTLDTVAWDTISFENTQHTLTAAYYAGGARSQLTRYVFDVTRRELVAAERVARRCAEFPSVAPRAAGAPHRHVYAAADVVDDDFYWGPAQAVVKATLDPLAGAAGAPGAAPLARDAAAIDAWSPGPRCIVNEPLFVPRARAQQQQQQHEDEEEDDGYVLVTYHDAATGLGSLAILDARDLSRGPVATLKLPHALPAGLHGSFSPEVRGDAGPATPKWVEPGVIKQV